YREVAHGIGSALPAFRFFYEQATTLRALWKMAVNLLAHCCPQTPVDFEHFRGVIPLIRGPEEMGVPFLHQDGFVRAADIQPISAPDRAHAFRLLHIGGWWLIYSSFFGGRIGSVVRFAGPNAE